MSYVESRITPRLKWYDKRAIWNKRAHLALEGGSAILSIALVLLIEIEVIPRVALSVIAALIAVLIALARIGRFGEKWQVYRLAAEAVEAEVQLFRHRAGSYALASAAAEQLLVERVEMLLNKEARTWSQITRVEDKAVHKLQG
jgi:hypothetical protein